MQFFQKVVGLVFIFAALAGCQSGARVEVGVGGGFLAHQRGTFGGTNPCAFPEAVHAQGEAFMERIAGANGGKRTDGGYSASDSGGRLYANCHVRGVATSAPQQRRQRESQDGGDPRDNDGYREERERHDRDERSGGRATGEFRPRVYRYDPTNYATRRR